MRKKRNSMLLVVLLVVVALGVGYAAIANQTLTINGYAHASENDGTFVVKFVPMTADDIGVVSNAYLSNTNTGTSATIAQDGKSATFDLVFTSKGTEYVIYKIKNESASLSAKVTVNSSISSTDETFKKYFTLGTPAFDETLTKQNDGKYNLSAEDSDITIAAGEYAFVMVPMTLEKDVVSSIGYDENGLVQDSTNKITVTLDAQPIESN